MRSIQSDIRLIGRRLGVNRVARAVIIDSIDWLKRSYAEGGPIQQAVTEAGRANMIRCAYELPSLPPVYGPNSHKVYFLSGEKYWYQTLYCYYSLVCTSGQIATPVILDDGSLTADIVDLIMSKIPSAEIISYEALTNKINEILPDSKYPMIHKMRKVQPLTRKLTDLHLDGAGWKMLLDSDMLFFKRADWLIDWLDAKNKLPAYMVDCVEAYGYSHELRAEIAGRSDFPDRANIGFLGWASDQIDFDWLEYAIGKLVETEGLRYNLTQGLASMMFAGRQCSVAPESLYIVKPSVEEGLRPTGILHHYVAESKRSYFQTGWRIIQDQIEEQNRFCGTGRSTPFEPILGS